MAGSNQLLCHIFKFKFAWFSCGQHPLARHLLKSCFLHISCLLPMTHIVSIRLQVRQCILRYDVLCDLDLRQPKLSAAFSIQIFTCSSVASLVSRFCSCEVCKWHMTDNNVGLTKRTLWSHLLCFAHASRLFDLSTSFSSFHIVLVFPLPLHGQTGS